MRLAELRIFLFDLGEAIFPSRPQFNCAAVSSGGQGWPPLGGHPKGLSLTAGSTVAGFVTRGRRRSSPPSTLPASTSHAPYNVREAEAGSPSKSVTTTPSIAVILLTQPELKSCDTDGDRTSKLQRKRCSATLGNVPAI